MGQKGRTSLVTGGAGFLGFHLCQRLLDAGDNVICVDDMTTGLWAHVNILRNENRYQFIEHDVTDPVDIPGKIDRIYNLASPASPPAYQANPVKTLLTNVLGARNLLDLADRKDARILQASTSEIYGDPKQHPQTESYRGNVATIGPRACYDEGKRCAETLFFDYFRTRSVDIRIARIFNTYGPGMRPDDGRVVSNFIMEALNGADLTVYGDGKSTRSFCYVDDLIDGLVNLMETNGSFSGPINLGNPREFTINELAQMVKELTGSKSRIVYLPEVEDDPHQRRPDISRAWQLMQWKPKIFLRQGLLPAIAYFRGLADEGEICPSEYQTLCLANV